MSVVQSGSINVNSLVVPDLYVQEVPPVNIFINGVPTNIGGYVGTAIYGPVNSPTVMGSYSDFSQVFGPMQTTKYDMGTHVAAAATQGANNFKCVRVTDSTDTAATGTLLDSLNSSPVVGANLTAYYTGTMGNTLHATISSGSSTSTANPTYRLTLVFPNGVPEIFDNIGGTGATFWANLVSAVNNGQSNARGPSKLCIATIGAGSINTPALTTVVLAGGTNGNTTITGTVLLGTDTAPRKGMYALRNSGASVVDLCDCDDSTTYAAQVAYGLSEGSYMMLVGPSGQSITAAVTIKQNLGIDTFAAKFILGDYIYFQDTTNNMLRVVSPQGFFTGLLTNLSPEQSSLNKQVQGVVGTQKSNANQTYSSADLQQMALSGLDVITNPVPGGAYYGVRLGRNCSSNAGIHGDNYTRMENYIAYTLNASMGIFVGQLQTPTERIQAQATLNAFLANLQQAGMIGTADGSPAYQVILDDTNNPPSQVALGYQRADVSVTFLSVVEYFVINLQGGQGVTVQKAA